MNGSVSINIDYSERALFVGKTGCGKTTLARRLLRHVERCVVLDPKATLADWGLEPWDSETQQRLLAGEPVRTRAVWDYERGDAAEFWEDVLEVCYRAGDVVVYIDELYALTQGGSLDAPVLLALQTRGRELGIGLWMTSQRPRKIPVFCVSESEHFFMFRLLVKRDREYMSDFMTEIVRDPIPAADTYGFYYMDVHKSAPVYVDRLRLDDE